MRTKRAKGAKAKRPTMTRKREPRAYVFRVRLSKSELASIEYAASSAKVSVSEWARSVLNGIARNTP